MQDAIAPAGKRIKLMTGGHRDHFSRNSIDNILPRLSLSVAPLRNTRLTAAAGQYSQFPNLVDLYGEFGTPNLGPERSNQATFAVEQFLKERIRIRVEAFDLQTRRGIYSAASQFRAASPDGPILCPELGPVFANSLRGYTRGIEFMVQRRSDNGLTGWIAYTLGYSRFTDATTQLHFWGDYDRRHTVNVFGSYIVFKHYRRSRRT